MYTEVIHLHRHLKRRHHALNAIGTLSIILFSPKVYTNILEFTFSEIIEGEGPEANEGDVVEFNYVCRRANGYFVHR